MIGERRLEFNDDGCALDVFGDAAPKLFLVRALCVEFGELVCEVVAILASRGGVDWTAEAGEMSQSCVTAR